MITPIQRDAIRILLSAPWFLALVAGSEIIIFAIGLIVGLKLGGN